MSTLEPLPCLDSPEMGHQRQRELQIGIYRAVELGVSAVRVAKRGHYINEVQDKVDVCQAVAAAVSNKVSITPDAPLPTRTAATHPATLVQVSNETTLGASRPLHDAGLRPLALNFANGIQPGGGFLHGARAQEEALCRSSALYSTLVEDPMYESHRQRISPDSTDWAIYSPDVPVFRSDDGTNLDDPWLLSFITCAAPYEYR